VMTSSVAAVRNDRDGALHGARNMTEADWADASDPRMTPYAKSKTLAERAAWDFVANGGLELAVVNPVGVFGPALGPDMSTSVIFIRRMMDGAMPGLPRMRFGVVDVRDVADLHLRAMTTPAAKGERFLAVAGDFMSLREIALTLKARLGPAARRVPTRELPDWVLRAASFADSSLRQIIPELGKTKNATGEKARRVLGWAPRSREDAIVATAESLMRLGLLKEKMAA
jgi:nucleoside-diphosphate-sugar epimerase